MLGGLEAIDGDHWASLERSHVFLRTPPMPTTPNPLSYVAGMSRLSRCSTLFHAVEVEMHTLTEHRLPEKEEVLPNPQ